MKRTVERLLIDKWIVRHRPNGIVRLSERSGVSITVIAEARTGNVPKKDVTQELLAEALEVSRDELFPLVETEEEAS